jgi:hypothetical protein
MYRCFPNPLSSPLTSIWLLEKRFGLTNTSPTTASMMEVEVTSASLHACWFSRQLLIRSENVGGAAA